MFAAVDIDDFGLELARMQHGVILPRLREPRAIIDTQVLVGVLSHRSADRAAIERHVNNLLSVRLRPGYGF